MKATLVICALLVAAFGCTSTQLSREKVIALARASLGEQQRASYPDVTDFIRMDHVHSWMVIFDNRQRDDGVWVMIDDHGEFVDAGPAYARD